MLATEKHTQTMDKNLIFDIGMHTGKDAEFYLRKGFRVVAVEADPYLASNTQTRLASYVDNGALTVLNVAIADYDGEIKFYPNVNKTDWGTTNPRLVRRNQERGTTHGCMKIECTRLEHVFDQFGIPYYMKIDIEGDDLVCLRSMLNVPTKPRYLSIEAQMSDDNQGVSELAYLWLLGYRGFKLIDQACNETLRCPYPPREGGYVEVHFDGEMTGLFGEETPGAWLNIWKAFRQMRKLCREQCLYGMEGERADKLETRLVRTLLRMTRGVSIEESWYDVHARLGSLRPETNDVP